MHLKSAQQGVGFADGGFKTLLRLFLFCDVAANLHKPGEVAHVV
jgi:hypothetical protein